MKSILLIAATVLVAGTANAGTYEYKGWRDNTNFSGSSGVENAARAKLHACSDDGIADESNWNQISTCTAQPFGSTRHDYNDHCEDETWDALCTGWFSR